MERQPSYTGTKLARLIESQGLRQDWIATHAGISKAHLSRIVRGERFASEDVARRIAEVLQVDIFLVFVLPVGNGKHSKGNLEAIAS